MIANPQRTHGRTRSMTCDTGTRLKARPSSRTSRITVSPTNNSRNSTWEDSTCGYMNSDSRSAVLFSVAASHSQKASSDTLGPAQLLDRKSTRLNSSHLVVSYAGCCLNNNIYLSQD